MQTDEDILKTIQQIIQKHFSNPKLKGALIAEELGVSRMTVHRLLKRTVGQNTRNYILDIRIKYAQQQLILTSKYVYQIAQEVGYFDAQQFAKVFKKMTRMTPTEFRKSKK
ncbi:MAG: helix-turn-helix domain-containing protein [Saprospiraceae bacterium]